MQNGFGLKDFVQLCLLVLLVVLVGLSMWQDDRRLEATAAAGARQDEVLTQLGALQREIARLSTRGVAVAPAPGGGSGVGDGGESAGDASAWAVPGVEVVTHPPLAYVTDPTDDPGFREGGEFVELFEAQMPKVMPFLGQDVYSRRVTDQVFEPLGDYHPETLEFRGVLAGATQLDPEGLWLRVRIRDAARFSDGEPVEASDVVYTWTRFIKNPLVDAQRIRSIADGVTEIREIDRLTVEFRFREALFTNMTVAMSAYVLPEHFYGPLTEEEINSATALLLGSGPFRLATPGRANQWRQGEDLVLVRNEAYWGGARPALRGLRYRVITDDIGRLTDYSNGNGDMMRPTSEQFVSRQRDEGWSAGHRSMDWLNMRSGYSFIAWQCGPRGGDGPLTPFADARVRRAMTHLIDRRFVIDEILEGIGTIATGPNSSAGPASNPGVEPLAYDLDEARRLLAEAGWADRDGDGRLENEAGDPFRFSFTFSQGSPATELIAQYLQDQCARVGIVCTPNKIDWAIFVDVLQSRDFDAITLGWSQSSPESDPRQLWHSSSIENRGDNFVQWASAEADRLIDEGRRTLDRERRLPIWHELHRVIHEEQPYTFMVERPWLRFVSREFENIVPYQKGLEQREFYAAPELN